MVRVGLCCTCALIAISLPTHPPGQAASPPGSPGQGKGRTADSGAGLGKNEDAHECGGAPLWHGEMVSWGPLPPLPGPGKGWGGDRAEPFGLQPEAGHKAQGVSPLLNYLQSRKGKLAWTGC